MYVAGCDREVSKPGFKLCYPCWKKQNGKQSSVSASSSNSDGEMLSATKIGQELGLSGQKLNLLLNELGWTYKPRHGKGWAATKQGKRQGAIARKVKQLEYRIWYGLKKLCEAGFYAEQLLILKAKHYQMANQVLPLRNPLIMMILGKNILQIIAVWTAIM